MHEIKKQAAQGDCLVMRIDELPADLIEQSPVDGVHIVAHSETGHNHTVPGTCRYFRDRSDDLTCYLSVGGDGVVLEHHRAWDTHASLSLPPGNYQIRRQREYVPGGWRRAAD